MMTVAEYERRRAYAAGELEKRGCRRCFDRVRYLYNGQGSFTWLANPNDPMICPRCGAKENGD